MSGYTAPNGKVEVAGNPRRIFRLVEDGTNAIPGRTAVRGSSDAQVKVGDGVLPPLGFFGFEGADPSSRPDDKATAYAADAAAKHIHAPILTGRDFAVLGKLAKGFVAIQGDDLFSWSEGRVVPGAIIGGMPAIRVPFVKKATVFDTGIDIPGGVLIHDVAVKVATEVAGSSIDVGFINAVESGDEDGFIDGEACTAKGFVAHNLVDDADSKLTLGAYLMEAPIKSADSTALYYRPPKLPGYLTDGTIKSLCYTTSNHDVAGDFYVMLSSPGIKRVGMAVQGKSAASADADIILEAVI